MPGRFRAPHHTFIHKHANPIPGARPPCTCVVIVCLECQDGSGHLTTDDILGPIEAAKERAVSAASTKPGVSAASGSHRTPHQHGSSEPDGQRKSTKPGRKRDVRHKGGKSAKVGPASW